MVFKLSLKSVAIAVIGALFLIQILSLLISQIVPSIQILRGGNAFLLLLTAIGVMTLFIVGTNLEQLKQRETLIFVVLVFGLIALAFWKGSDYFPMLFKISPEVSNTIKQTIGAILGG